MGLFSVIAAAGLVVGGIWYLDRVKAGGGSYTIPGLGVSFNIPGPGQGSLQPTITATTPGAAISPLQPEQLTTPDISPTGTPKPTVAAGGKAEPYLTDAAARKAVYKGGPVYNKGPASVHFIYWGREWDNPGIKASRAQINDAMQRLFSSRYFDGLQQYGVSRPVIGGIVNNLTYPVPRSTEIPWDNIPKVVLDCVRRKQVPNPDTGPLRYFYFVWAPPGHNIPGYGGLHLYSTTPKGTTFTWAGVVYPSAPHPLIPDTVDNLTQAFTHEIVDSFTNPTSAQGYVVSPCTDIPGDPHNYKWDPQACEIAQWCGHMLKKSPATGNVLVESYYSNADGKCIIPQTVLTTGDAKY